MPREEATGAWGKHRPRRLGHHQVHYRARAHQRQLRSCRRADYMRKLARLTPDAASATRVRLKYGHVDRRHRSLGPRLTKERAPH